MKLLFVADGRSPIARNWIRYFVANGHETHLVSTFECQGLSGLATLHWVPVAFSGLRPRSSNAARPGPLTSSRTIGMRTFIRHWLGPATVSRAARRVRERILGINPDLVHAMRIPFEGALASAARPEQPLVVSIWGNDFTLHAPASPMMSRLTRRTMQQTTALHTDNHRDAALAVDWGFDREKAQLVVPGNGGVRREIFHAGEPGGSDHPVLTRVLDSIAPEAPVVVNPRGFRAYVRNDTFFAAIPEILEREPSTVFLCPDMAGQTAAEEWVERLNISKSVHLLPKLTPADLAVVFRRAQVSVSPSEHDGTPNTLLEAMACGAYPVVGDLPSVREWIEEGSNGTLIDPSDAGDLAGAVVDSLGDSEHREQAAGENDRIIADRADYGKAMLQAAAFYERIVA